MTKTRGVRNMGREWSRLAACAALAACCAVAVAGCGGQGASSSEGAQVFVAMSYSGNNWQNEASNSALAIARMSPNDKKVKVKRDIAGTKVQSQISQYQSMVASGAKAIVSFPVSPTGLNQAIRKGCKQGAIFVMYDATVTEPCAWNVSFITSAPADDPEHPFFGTNTAEALVKLMDGKGNIFLNRGVPGTSVDETHYLTAKAVFDRYPGIHIIDSYYGMWSAATSQQETAKALAAHADVDGVWSQDGEGGVLKALKAVGKEVPVTGENGNYFRLQLHDGWPGVSSGSPPGASGGIAMKVALKILEDGPKSVPRDIEIPLPWVPADGVKICPGKRFVDGCNAFKEGSVPDQFVTEVFESDLLPESSVTSALTGNPTPGAKFEELPDMTKYEQPPERRYITRHACDPGWKPGKLPQGVQGCVR